MSDSILLGVLNMSFTASFVIVGVLLVRLLLRRAPKIYSYALWSVVLFRLVCPFSLESALSLLPAKPAPISMELFYSQNPQVDTGISSLNRAINASLPAPAVGASVNPLQIWLFLGEAIWLIGIAVLLLYSVISLVRLRSRLKDARHSGDNIWLSDTLDTPFVMGMFRPKIYLPAGFSASEKEYILLHEQTHMRRFDHIVKLISFFVLCVHWFNPLVWAAFFLSGRDMEMSCDEAVLKTLGPAIKKEYSSSLLSLASGRRIIGGTPLAFGEGDTRGRIQNVLKYQTPALWLAAVSLIVISAFGVGLALNPVGSEAAPGPELPLPTATPSAISPEDGSLPLPLSSDLEESISKAILSRSTGDYYAGEAAGEGHITLECKTEGRLTYVYLIEQYMEFGFENGELTDVSGHRNPAALVFSRDDGGVYSLQQYEHPMDGADFRPSLRELFSKSALELYDNAEGRDSEKTSAELSRQLEAYGDAYLKQIGRDAKISLNPGLNRIVPHMNVEASNYLSDSYAEYPYWIGTRERVENGVRYVYEKQWKDNGGGGGDGVVTFIKSVYDPSGARGEIVEKTVIEIKDGSLTATEGTLREEHYSKYH